MTTSPRVWTMADALETYAIPNWSSGFFGINEKGHVMVHPEGSGGPAADLKELVDEVIRRGIDLPVLLRFTDILNTRSTALNEAFRRAIQENGFKGGYRGVFPIKVNQHRWVLEEIVKIGRPFHYGLEAGSKPELLAVMALLEDEEALIICNGYKDEEYVETALLANKLGRNVILVVEKISELHLIAEVAKRMKVKPRIGVRVKLSSRGAGRWEASGGDRSKFGLFASECMEAIGYLREQNLLDCFELMHFHLGSQISNIRSIKNGLREASRFFVELCKQGAPLKYIDVGGGLGVDYDGSQTNFSCSVNYTLQEYANDVVYSVFEQCEAEKVPHPTIVSESGRAVVAHHAVLVVGVLGTSEFEVKKVPDSVPESAPSVLKNLIATYKDVTRKNVIEAWHDALEYKEECLTLFSLGHLSLEQRVAAENVYWALCLKILKISKELDELPEELEPLEKALSDIYFCNFSVFQSLPDSWAVDMLFPIMPIHRLNEQPTHKAVLGDITCDSDGKIDHFIDKRDVKDVLELHPMNGEPYYLGIFLVGAYQEILGDLHNLFGDTHAVQVKIQPAGYQIEHVVPGDTVAEVLHHVMFDREDLMTRLRRASEVALRAGRITLEESRHLLRAYEEGLSGYTYLEREG
ncbi:MAG: biosynthetic arginine decarboxylase [Deltaproteobacteria bacterium]|nr:biosynthetic arginine decarboxylase [Deltaproteobacteria bacterium]